MAQNPAPNNNGNSIIITIQAATVAFTTSVKTALNNAVKNAQVAGAQISANLNKAFNNQATQTFNTQLQKMGQALINGQAAFKALTASANQYKDVAMALGAISQQNVVTMQLLDNIAAEYGVSLQKAGKIAIQTGEAEVAAVQATLAANNKVLLSKKELIGTLGILEQNIKRVAAGQQMITETVQGANDGLIKQRKVAEQNSGAMGFLANRLKAVVTSLIIAGATYKFIQFLSDVVKEAIAVSQSLFNFETAVKASQKVLGLAAAGSLADWEDAIIRLGKELKVFSQRDIRDATTQVINLTKVLNLSKGDIEDIIRVSAALAETTGVDLNQAVSDVVHALGGSRVVLDKYGLFIRDTDLRTQSLTDGLGSNTAALTSQQLALVTLHEILRQTNPLIQSIANYEETLAGAVKATEAEIENTTDSLSTELGTLNLLFKTLYAAFLTYVKDVTTEFKPLMAFVDTIIVKLQDYNNSAKNGLLPPDPQNYGVGPGVFAMPDDSNYGGHSYKSPESIYGNDLLILSGILGNSVKEIEANRKRYEKAIEDWKRVIDKQSTMDYNSYKFNKQIDDGGSVGQQPGWNYPGPTGGSYGPGGNLTDSEQKGIDDFTDGIDKLLLDRNRKMEDARTKYTQDWQDSWKDETADMDKIEKDFIRDLADINTKIAQDIEDAGTDLRRSMATVDSDEASKLEQIEKEKNDKLLEIKNDYYDALAALDREYYFDLFDASANNDAVALKNAERKYNLEKAKLKDKLNDDTEKTSKGAKDSVEKLKKETADRKAELQLRYQQELDDIAKNLARKEAELKLDRDREREDTKQHYIDLRAELTERYKQEKAVIDRETGRRYNDLVSDLAKELVAQQDHLKKILKEWDDYFDDLLELEADYKDERAKANDPNNGSSNPTPLQSPCLAGQHYDADKKKCVNDHNNPDPQASDIATNIVTNGTANTYTIVLTSDGTVGDEAVEKVAAELANIFENIVTRKGAD